MRFLVLDLETTGFSFEEDWITEIGAALFEVGNATPLNTYSWYLESQKEIPKEVIDITGITDEMLEEFGEDLVLVLGELRNIISDADVDYIVAHNGEEFDKPMLLAHYERVEMDPPTTKWIDTRTDLPLTYKAKSMSLTYMAADHGFVNPFPHRAVFDALTCGKILMQYDIQKVLALALSPVVNIRAVVTYDDRDLAKQRGYRWDAERKIWCKKIKEIQLEKEKTEAQFQVVIL